MRKVAFFLLSLVLVVGYILFAASRNYVYYLTADELALQSVKYEGKRVKVSGTVVESSRNGRSLVFVIEENGKRVKVSYEGAIPDAFGVGMPVVVEGKYDGNSLRATTLLTKCPSKYESQSQP
ncbi:MAG: cytochrome c maturation protein CcmE [Thermotogae bacterium]|nr:cytochrome c maturation protein CcmE [Thermotogota bacterium]